MKSNFTEPATITIQVEYLPYGGNDFDRRIIEEAKLAANRFAATLILDQRIVTILDIDVKHKR